MAVSKIRSTESPRRGPGLTFFDRPRRCRIILFYRLHRDKDGARFEPQEAGRISLAFCCVLIDSKRRTEAHYETSLLEMFGSGGDGRCRCGP